MILFHSTNTFNLFPKKKYKTWIKELILSKNKKEGDISFLFRNDEEILDINQKFLQHDTYTDIITFDYSEENVISGDIFVSIERVKENAEKFQVSFHQVGLLDMLNAASLIGKAPKTLIFGVQPKSLDWSMDLSPEIQAVFPRLTELVLREIDSIQKTGEFISDPNICLGV